MNVSGRMSRVSIASFAGVVLVLLPLHAAVAGLIHRWSFSETGGSGTALTDSVGTADAMIVESGANNADVGTTVAGQVYLTGGGKGASDYVELPDGTLRVITGDATIELWATPYTVKNWSRVFSFGSSNTDMLMASWSRATNINQDQLRWNDTGVTLGDTDNAVNDSMAPYALSNEVYIAITIDVEATGPGSKTVVTWYKDAQPRGAFDTFNRLSDLGDTESVLGRSKWGDDTANASYNELRIYDAVLTSATIADHFAVGPDVIPPENTGASDVTMTSAKINGNLPMTDGLTHVYAHWGEHDFGSQVATQNALLYGFYDNVAVENLTLDDGLANGINGGLMAQAPTLASNWTSEVWEDGPYSDSYCRMWSGLFTAPIGGTYTVYVHGDDNEVLWIDLNQNGEFEETAGELISDSRPPEGWNTPHTETVVLAAGETYPIAMAYYEGGGGDFFNITLTLPGGGTAQRINPGAPEQAGWWSVPGWANVEYLGIRTVGAVSTTVAPLTADTVYYYRYFASNAVWQLWAPDSASFRSLASDVWGGNINDLWTTAGNWGAGDVPDTAGESARFTGQGTGPIDLNGSDLTVGPITLEAGNYTLTDSGNGRLTTASLTNSAGDNAIAAATTVGGTTVVTGGSLTLASPGTFAASVLELAGGDAVVDGPVQETTGQLIHRGFNFNNDGLHNLNNNGGLMALVADGETLLTMGPGNRGLDFNNDADWVNTGAVTVNDNYMNLFLGYFTAQESGVHHFRVNQDDDVSSLWLDTDQNGVFDAPSGYNTGENLSYETYVDRTVNLVAGESYLFAVTHREGGGGSGIHVMFRTPSMGAEATIIPADAAQAAMWSTRAYGAVDFTHVPITVSADSGLGAVSDTAAAFGTLVVDSAGALTVRGNSRDTLVTFASAAVTGDVNAARGNVVLEQFTTGGDSTIAVARGATLTVDAPVTADAVLSYGILTAPGTITAATRISFDPTQTITNILDGTAEVRLGESRVDNGSVALVATNTYTGDTVIQRARLHADGGVGLPNGSALRFWSLADDDYAMLETTGTFARTIGTTGGAVYWNGRGGFSALGGPLSVVLNGGAPLTWNSATDGFNGQYLQLSSVNADSAVELSNDIAIDDADRIVFTWDNAGSKTDVAILSGVISGTDPANDSNFRKYRDGTLWLRGTNTFEHNMWHDDGVLRIDSEANLPPLSTLVFDQGNAWGHCVLEGKGTFTRNIGPVTEQGTVSWDWQHGGFAAYDGPFNVTLEGGIQLDWGSVDTGFDGHYLQLGSRTANDVVELTNPIDLNAAERHIMVFDNDATTNDVSILSGVITGSNPDEELWKNNAGVLVLSGANTYQQDTVIDSGVLRADDGVGVPVDSTVIFDEANAAIACIWETSGTITRNVGPITELGAVSWDWQHGGFAAFGGPLTVNLEGGATLTSNGGPDAGFDDHVLHLGSRTANAVVTIANGISMANDYFEIRAFDNPDRTDDFAVLAGEITYAGWGDLGIRGQGTVKMVATNVIRQLRVYDSAIAMFNGDHMGTDYVFTENGQNGTIGGNGHVRAFNYIDVRTGGTLAPGDGVGTLDVTVDGIDLEMWAGSTYAWQIGGRGSDTVKLTGNLRLTAGWQVKLQDAGGLPVASEEYDLFTYTGVMNDYNAPVLDLSEVPASWVTGSVQVVHDPAGKRVYLTGLASTLGVGNRPASNLAATSAQLNGVVSCSNDALHVWVYWGDTDGGVNAGSWANGLYLGAYSNGVDLAVDTVAAGLTGNTPYYFTFRATNATSDIWASPSADFMTLGAPVVENDGAEIAKASAALAGRFLDHNRGMVTLCWGLSDGGTTLTSDWEHAVSLGTTDAARFMSTAAPLYFPNTYYYRCYATNAYGSDWSDTATSFTVTRKPGSKYPEQGLMGRWVFDDSTARDSSGNDYHGENVGGAYSTDVPPVLAGGKSIDLTAGDYMVKVDTGGTQDDFDLDAISVSCWIKGWPDGNWEPWVSKRGENGEGYQFRRVADSEDVISWTMRGPGNDDWGATSNVNDAAWHHVVATYGAGYRRIYVDGVLIGEEIRLGPINDTADMLVFGARQSGGVFGWHSRMQLDDILIYNRPLTADEVDQLHGNTESSYITIDNGQATDVTTNTATLNAEVSLVDSVYDVWVYWGQTDEGTNSAGAWDDLAFVGTYTDYVGTVSHAITGLTPGTTHWYTFRLINAQDSVWAMPSESLLAVTAPAVDNANGADVAVGGAVLNGRLTAGNSADVTVYWGRSDGGMDPGAWDAAVPLADTLQGAFSASISAGYGATYYYRCYAANAAGDAWATATTNFATVAPPTEGPEFVEGLRGSIFLGIAQNETQLNLDSAGFSNSFVRVLVGDKPNTVLTLAEDAGYNVIASGSIEGWNQFPGFATVDSFVTAFSGRIFPRTTGMHAFRWDCDDRGLMYIDRNRDGVFDNDERVAAYAWGATGYVTLTNGVGGYDFIFMAQEYGGGESVNWFVTEPDGAEERVDTVAQAPMWQYMAGSAALLGLENTAVSDVSTDAVTINADLMADGWTFDVHACWGTTDGGASTGNWDAVVSLGDYVNHDGGVSLPLTGLVQGQLYWYSFYAANSATSLWGGASVAFSSLGMPQVANEGASDVSGRGARLNGSLNAGGTADVLVYWGTTDGGTDAGAWENAIPLDDLPLGAFACDVSVWGGGLYFYRCYATNSVGHDWADSTDSFVTAAPRYRYRAGLLACHVPGNMYMGAGNNGNLGIVLGPYGGRSAAEHWSDIIGPDTSTLFYQGQIYLGDSPVTFVKSIDDNTRLSIDQELVINNGAWNDTVHGTITRPAGWYDLDLRFSNGGGGYGPSLADGWTAAFGFGIDVEGRDDEEESHFVFPEDPGDQTLFRYYDASWTGVVASVALANGPVTDVSTSAATMNATLAATGWVFHVYALWGESDGGTAFNDWDHVVDLGFLTNFDGVVNHSLSGLSADTDYWYAFHATNALTNVWGGASETFQVMSAPTIANAAATDITQDSAVLNAALLTGGFADVTVYWGTSDGGASPGAWTHAYTFGTVPAGSVSTAATLVAGGTYYYRYYATNGYGDDWADTTELVQALPTALSVSDASVLEGDAGQVAVVFDVTLSHVSASNVTVTFATVDGLAKAGLDYTATSGTLAVPAGLVSTQVTVLVSGDTVGEYPSESFTLELSAPVNATLGDGVGTATIVDDDVMASLGQWKAKMQITFSGYSGGETLINFPALVLLGENMADFRYGQFKSVQAHDLMFTDATQNRILNHEIEYWDVNGTSAVWVQVPELSGTNTVIWAYWGNDNPLVSAAPPSYSVDGSTWSEGYEVVLHFANDVKDATKRYTASPVGAPSYSTALAVAGPAIDMNGVGDYVDLSDGFSDFSGGITVEAWARTEALRNWARIMDFGNGAGVDNIVMARIAQGMDMRWEFHDVAPADAGMVMNGGNLFVLNEWQFFAGTCSAGARNAATARIYRNGVGEVVNAAATPPPVVTRVNNYIGESNWGGDDFFEGQMDEFRISTVERSADWLMAVHQNMIANGTFNTYGMIDAPKGMLLIIR